MSGRDLRDALAAGGDEAVRRGCRCPVMDNGRGDVELARDRGGWWIVSDCSQHRARGPLHAHSETPSLVG